MRAWVTRCDAEMQSLFGGDLITPTPPGAHIVTFRSRSLWSDNGVGRYVLQTPQKWRPVKQLRENGLRIQIPIQQLEGFTDRRGEVSPTPNLFFVFFFPLLLQTEVKSAQRVFLEPRWPLRRGLLGLWGFDFFC